VFVRSFTRLFCEISNSSLSLSVMTLVSLAFLLFFFFQVFENPKYYPNFSSCLFFLLLFLLYMYMLYKDTHHLFTREFKEEEDRDKG